MEQMYLIEIFIDKVTIFVSEENEETNTNNKNVITKVKFGPKEQFIIKEGQLAVNERKDDIIETDEKTGKRKWSRTVRVGKSYLFPAYPDTILNILSNYPLEIEVWNDDDTEPDNNIFVGVGKMIWDTHFFFMLKETTDPCKIHEPLSIKSRTALMAECCCSQVGDIDFILRLSALGASVITEFQQILKDPESFVFRTNKAPSMFQCKRVDGADPNFCMVGSLYETTTLEDPDILDKVQNKIEVCTELQSCGIGAKEDRYICTHDSEEYAIKKKFNIDKIRIGDITGPCGNKNCPLAHKIRKYIRTLDTYKSKAAGITDTKEINENKVCGKCICKDDRWHRDECPKDTESTRITCTGCQGKAPPGATCEQKKAKLFGTGITPTTSEMQVAYVFSITKFPQYKQGMFGKDTIVEDCYFTKRNNSAEFGNKKNLSQEMYQEILGCSSQRAAKDQSGTKAFGSRTAMLSFGTNDPMIYNMEAYYPQPRLHTVTACQMSTGTGTNCVMTYNVGTSAPPQSEYKRKAESDEKVCRCNPTKPSPPCKTFDCDCLSETLNIASRKNHRPYCPSYKHKLNCPVTMMHEEEELLQKKVDEDEEEVTPLPYGLPPIQLGPCPVLGRPCTVPDGFARMYRNALLPTQPYSYSDDGKVCCSKEFDRIKKAIKEYMKYEKDHDYRCINKFNVDTERRCCDKEQILMRLMGKACCASHKMGIVDKKSEENKKPEEKKQP